MRAGQIAVVAAWIGLVSPAGADAPSAMEVLKKAQAAAKGLDALEYEAEFRCGGVMTSFLRDQAGKVTLARGSNAPPRLRLDATMLPADEKGSLTFQMASDGVMNYVIDHRKKRYVCADMHDSSAVMGMPPTGLLMPVLMSASPFREEMRAKSVTYEGTEKVGQVECHVVLVQYAGPDNSARWSFSTKDFLPRRVQRTVTMPNGRGTSGLLLKSFKQNPPLSKELFRLPRPEGYTTPTPASQPAKRKPRKLLELGNDAPNWSLKTPDGRTVTLKGLRGKVVVLDFWAIWCAPCRLGMPEFQKLHKQYRDKPVAVLGVNCNERGDPIAYMKKHKLTYGLLLNGEKIMKAYQTHELPTLYVIGHDGKVLYADTGFPKEKEKQDQKVEKIRQAIELGLARMK
jgi:thiol-disulfide isomerase/thioredoxin